MFCNCHISSTGSLWVKRKPLYLAYYNHREAIYSYKSYN